MCMAIPGRITETRSGADLEAARLGPRGLRGQVRLGFVSPSHIADRRVAHIGIAPKLASEPKPWATLPMDDHKVDLEHAAAASECRLACRDQFQQASSPC